ncbi:MAG: nucleic acid-binding protein [Candidatus Thermoplasmatota archaeon]
MKTKKKVIIIDTSAILSGKPIAINNAKMITASSILQEIRPGGRDHHNLEYLINKDLNIETPSKESINTVKKTAEKTGDLDRLSEVDIDIAALALDYHKKDEDEVTILTDDYSIQNIAETLHIKFQGLNQVGITKKFKWIHQCPGCKKKYNKNIKTCLICGTKTRLIPVKKIDIKEQKKQG